MKLRIQDSSVRFRITLKELETLRETGSIVREARVPAPQNAAVFRYEVVRDEHAPESALQVEPFVFRLVLSAADFAELADPKNEGAYVRREWTDEGGQTQRFLAFIEKDRPGSTCIKQEAWIYDVDHLNRNAETRPIPSKS